VTEDDLRALVREELAAGKARIPHARFLMGLTVALLAAFAVVSCIVLLNNYDGLTKGGVIQTWINLAFGSATFWLGSSMAGKQVKP